MDIKLEIVIVEDDPKDLSDLIVEIDANRELLSLVGNTGNAEQAFEMVSEIRPDVLILDLELQKGYGDGMDLLKKIHDAAFSRPPFILIVTHNISTVTHDIARKLGADYIMTKCQEGYTAKLPIEFLKMSREMILSRKSVEHGIIVTATQQTEYAEKRFRRLAYEEMNLVGINPKSSGYQYLADAIVFLAQGKNERVYQMVAKKNMKSEAAVERAMQNAINRAWNTAPPENLLKHYRATVKSDRGVPTITEFIYYYSNIIKTS
ncbi:MAG: response regulator [Clostridia bacterium]|nr:response regulator [Clostridia bacterium]